MVFSTFARTMIPATGLVRTVVGVAVALSAWVLVGSVHEVHGQDTRVSCVDTLETAEEVYRNREYQEVITLANDCTDPQAVGDTTAIRALRVMSLAFLRQGAIVQAHSAILNILAIDPTYVSDPISDPPSYNLFVSLVREESGPAASDSVASDTRSEDDAQNIFLKVFGIGLSDYTGDLPSGRMGHPFDVEGFSTASGYPYVFSFELGYFVSPKFALVLGFQAGNYQRIGYAGPTRANADRYTPQLLARYMFGNPQGTVTPFIDGGYNVTFGGGSSTNPGMGPSFGGGLNIALSRSTSLVIESRYNLTFPDDAIDGADDVPKGSITGPFDSVNQLLGVGVKVDLGRHSDPAPSQPSEQPTPPVVSPDTLDTEP